MPLDTESRRRGGLKRAAQFTSETQSRASRAQKEKHSDKLSEWGLKGYRQSIVNAGFDTTYADHARRRIDHDNEPPF